MDKVAIDLLGPIRLRIGGVHHPIRRERVRALLTLLALHPGRTVPIDVMIEALWNDDLPKDPVHAVHVYMCRLRSVHPALAVVVQTEPAGYSLNVAPELTDAARFESLASRAGVMLVADAAGACGLLSEALELWRGPAFGSLHYAEFLADAVARLDEQRLTAVEHSYEADIRLGNAQRVVPELRRLVVEHPFRDRPTQLLVWALDASGRQAEALMTFRNYCQLIEGEFGVAPTITYADLVAAAL